MLYTQYLSKLQQQKILRTIPSQKRLSSLLDFSHNDYLGLSKNPHCLEKGYAIAKEYGIGSTGSRLLSGALPLMTVFENQIAIDKHTEKALLFPTGYQANSTVLTQLLNTKAIPKKTIVFFDKANHASLYHALFISNTTYKRFPHNDITSARALIEQYSTEYEARFLVIESIYGMDGDIAPLEEYISLCKEFNIFLYIDEAHATGIFGEHGYGLSTLYDFTGIEYCIMGTFSKALGGMGAYIASHSAVIDYLISTCGGFIYSTAPSPFLVGAMYSAWKYLPSFQRERAEILRLAQLLRQGIVECGYSTSPDCTHIVPLISESVEHIMYLYDILQRHGIYASCIRPPTVPPNAPRLRFAINITHTQEHIDYLLSILRTL